MGIGYEHGGLSLRCSGQTSADRGIFVNTNRNPILIMNEVNTDVNPPPYNEFVYTG